MQRNTRQHQLIYTKLILKLCSAPRQPPWQSLWHWPWLGASVPTHEIANCHELPTFLFFDVFERNLLQDVKCCREALPLVLASSALYSARRSSSKPTDFNHCCRESSAMSKCHLSPQLRRKLLQSPPPNLSWEGTSTASSTLNHSIIAFWNMANCFKCARSYSMYAMYVFS